jgi:hypothetical protein
MHALLCHIYVRLLPERVRAEQGVHLQPVVCLPELIKQLWRPLLVCGQLLKVVADVLEWQLLFSMGHEHDVRGVGAICYAAGHAVIDAELFEAVMQSLCHVSKVVVVVQDDNLC